MGVILNSHVPLNLTDRVHTKTVFFLVFFFVLALIAEKSADEKPCFALAPKWCNATPRSVLLRQERTLRLGVLFIAAAEPVRRKQQWQMYRTKRWMPESERIWHSDTGGERLDGFSLCSILYCIVSVSRKTQHPTPTPSRPWWDRKPIEVRTLTIRYFIHAPQVMNQYDFGDLTFPYANVKGIFLRF